MRISGGYFDPDQKRQKIMELEDALAQPDAWNHHQAASARAQELAALKEETDRLERLERDILSVSELTQTSLEEDDQSLVKELTEQVSRIEHELSDLDFSVLLSGPHDRSHALVALHAGVGGVDAMDWTQMLARMYLRYCEKRGWRTEVVDESRGQEAGIKSMVIRVMGDFAYGRLKSEAGVHRLVRISPFDAEKMRHTSFALVEVLPELAEIEDIPIKEDDLRIDTFMAGGHGGQSVNTTYSAVRVVHIPTGITVKCQNERSQLQNKEMALKILKSKLMVYAEAKREEERAQLRGEFSEAAWGNQARSYVIHPYKMVKDHRTEYESQYVEEVLEGDLDELIEAYLKYNVLAAD